MRRLVMADKFSGTVFAFLDLLLPYPRESTHKPLELVRSKKLIGLSSLTAYPVLV